MDTTHWTRVEALFSEALAHPPAERQTFVEKASGGDTHIFEEVMSLLEKLEEANSYFDAFEGQLRQGWGETNPLQVGDQVGGFEVVEEIGRGGMSVVYAAKRIKGDFEERVAIKVLKKGMDTAAVLMRFRQEQQLLANLRHPGIASILEGGQTPEGQPYLVMELIDGLPLLEGLEQQNQAIGQRLQTFLQITQAVQHAHQRLVVHRDLKPANILITETEQVKLLDFGIAKLLDHPDETLLQTGTHHRLMTPRYAAPEQREGGPVSTATDVYQLGLILGEMLLPLVKEEKVLPSELRDIIGMATREQPERRYSSASELGRDVRNYLEDRPIEARPESLGYQIQKFVRRNRIGVLAAAAVLLAIISGGLIAGYQAEKAKEALARETEAREEAEFVTDFLVSLFRKADPYRTQYTLENSEMSLREFIDISVPSVRADLKEQPAVQIRVMGVIGELYDNLSYKEESYEINRETLALVEQHLGKKGKEYADGVIHLASTAHDLGKFQEADSLYLIALEVNKAVYGNSPKHLEVVYNNFGLLRYTTGRVQEADSLYELSLAMMYENGVVDTPNFAQTLNNRSEAFWSMQEWDSSYVYAKKAIEVLELANEQGGIYMAHAYSRFAQILIVKDSLEQALYYEQQAQPIFGALIGPRSHFYSLSLYTQSKIYQELGEFAREKAALDTTMSILEELYGKDDINYRTVSVAYGAALGRNGEAEKGLVIMEEALSYFAANDFNARLTRGLYRYVEQALEWNQEKRARNLVKRYLSRTEGFPEAEKIRDLLE